MECVLYTQRVEVVESYGERRDCAHQAIPCFISSCGYLPIPLPNIPEYVEQYFLDIKPKGIVMTGGNSLEIYGGNAPEKDETDSNVIKYALKYQVPIYAFCRGMQSVLHYFGEELRQIQGHIAVRHVVSGEWMKREVNSFHQQGFYEVTKDFDVMARSADGMVEAVRHRRYPIVAVMWHPEREEVFNSIDISCVKQLFSREKE